MSLSLGRMNATIERHDADQLPGRPDAGADLATRRLPRAGRRRCRDTVDTDVRLSTTLSGSVLGSIDEASEFFRAGSTGWSPGFKRGDLDGLRLDTDAWRVEPTTPVRVRASRFDKLPAGSAELDSVLLMRDVPAVWNPVGNAGRGMIRV